MTTTKTKMRETINVIASSLTDTSKMLTTSNLLDYSLALRGVELERAEVLARFALDRQDDLAVRATLGSILVQTHDPETGVKLLFEGLPLATAPSDEFDTRLFLAHGLARLGRSVEADQQRALAAAIAADLDVETPPALVKPT